MTPLSIEGGSFYICKSTICKNLYFQKSEDVSAGRKSPFGLISPDPNKELVWGIMDDLMDTLQVANPRVYNGGMRKIRGL